MSRPPIDKWEEEEIAKIAKIENRPPAQARRLLVRLGIRVWRSKRGLSCAFNNCTRADCCGGAAKSEALLQELRRGPLRLVVDNVDKLAVVTVALILAVVGCASLTPEGERVRITVNSQATSGCKFLGKVKGKLDNDLRNEAAKLGANLVWNETEAVRDAGPRIWQHGEAYSCPVP